MAKDKEMTLIVQKEALTLFTLLTVYKDGMLLYIFFSLGSATGVYILSVF
jgi:hypothetical protein